MIRVKKIILFSLLCLLAFTLNVEAASGTINFTSFYPAPIGKYKSIRLLGLTHQPDSNCDIGTLYLDTSTPNKSIPYYCASLAPSTSPFSQYQLLPGVWGLNSLTNSLYVVIPPALPSNLNNVKVGIGTLKPVFKLSLDNDGGILADDTTGTLSVLPVEGQGAGARLVFYPKKMVFRAGYAPANQWDEANLGVGSTVMGYQNQSSGSYSTILGGRGNTLSGDYSFIGGGFTNSSLGVATNIIGGYNNQILSASRYHVIGGFQNKITCSENGCGILGGGNNIIDGDRGNAIAGGNTNKIIGINSFIGGGLQNNISTINEGQTIFGGRQNITGQLFNTIWGGFNNQIYGAWGTIAGGNTNLITAPTGTGATAPQSTISGGLNNTINSLDASGTISGGRSNTIAGDAPASSGARSIVGGQNNTARGTISTILGGKSNTATGAYAIIVGGESNSTTADNSLVAGKNMTLDTLAARSFRWGFSSSPGGPNITKPDSFIINSGRIGIRDTSPAALLEINANGSLTDNYLILNSYTPTTTPGDKFVIKNNGNGTASIGVGVTGPTRPLEFSNGAYIDTTGNFMSASSREYKENITNLDLNQAMKTLSGLKPVRFNYKNDRSEEYVGFIAEDVPDLVVSKQRDGLAPMDIAAVLNKVIQHQQEVLQEQELKSKKLLKEIEELEIRAKHLKNHE